MSLMQKDAEREMFEEAIRALEAEVASVGVFLSVDAGVRLQYTKKIQAMSVELRTQAATGKISWEAAAAQAQEARNTIMSVLRNRSTPVGLAIAQNLKSEGKTLNELVAKKAQQLFGKNVVFNSLPVDQKNSVYAEIVKSAGKSNPKITATMRKLSGAGRGLIFISIALSVYTVATAENKSKAVVKEVTVAGAGIGGGIAGGALAGLACGPGAPLCVTVGAFVGGALVAFGVSSLW